MTISKKTKYLKGKFGNLFTIELDRRFKQMCKRKKSNMGVEFKNGKMLIKHIYKEWTDEK